MNKAATSKESLLETARRIVSHEGASGLSIRRVASESGVATGTVYNYYPSKADLVLAVVEDFWRHVFHGSGFHPESDDFIGSFSAIYQRLRESLSSFQDSFLDEMASMSQKDRQKGRQMEREYFSHMKAGLLQILERDPRVSKKVWAEDFTKEQLVDFAFSNLMAMLREDQEGSSYMENVLRRLMYDESPSLGP